MFRVRLWWFGFSCQEPGAAKTLVFPPLHLQPGAWGKHAHYGHCRCDSSSIVLRPSNTAVRLNDARWPQVSLPAAFVGIRVDQASQ